MPDKNQKDKSAKDMSVDNSEELKNGGEKSAQNPVEMKEKSAEPSTAESDQKSKQDTSDQSQKKSKDTEGVRADKGSGYFPLTDLQFDVVTIIFEKSKALQAYDKYLLDSQPNEEVRKIFEEIAADDRKHVEKLSKFLGKF